MLTMAICQKLLRSFCYFRRCINCNQKMFGCAISNVTSSSITSSTIYALSSAPGKAGVAVIRVSGPSSVEVIHRMTNLKSIPPARQATLTRVLDPLSGEVLDRAILIYFKGPASFTGEDCCELHVHSGVAVVASVLNALSKVPNFAFAQAGEFTRRSFLNGKLDLTAVEGLADLIAAETEAQRKQALRQMDGELYSLYNGWRSKIMKVAAYIEAFIDFSEDENIDVNVMTTVVSETDELRNEIKAHLSDNRRGERLRSGVHAVIVGEPNVGKSSLLNIISQRPAAIVSPVAGTTRDVVESHVNIGGFPVLLSDTAGLRQSLDQIEQEGIHRALEKARVADLIIVLLDPIMFINRQELTNTSAKDVIEALYTKLGLKEILTQEGVKTLIVINKMDTVQDGYLTKELQANDYLLISCKTKMGTTELLEKLKDSVKDLCTKDYANQSPLLTQERHRIHLTECVERLDKFFDVKEMDLAIAAYHLRKSGNEIGMISGEFTTEDLLDIIFKDFCIGK